MSVIEAFRWVLVSAVVLATLRAAPAHPAPGPLYVLTVAPQSADTLYAGNGNGVWRSVDGGVAWSLTSLRNATYSLAVDALDPSTVYAGTEAGVFKSTDAGSNWLSTGPISGNIPVLAIDPFDSSTLYAGGEGGLFKSADGGATWLNVMDAPVRSFAIDPVSPRTLYAGMAFSSVFKSTDGGDTWSLSLRLQLNPDALGYGEPQMTALAVDPAAPSTLYVGNGTAPACCPDGTAGFEDAQGGAIFNSTDAGATWHATTMGVYWFSEVQLVVADGRAAGTAYALRDRTLYKSIDVGNTWHGVSPGGVTSVHALAVDSRSENATMLYVDTNLGILRSTDGGATWTAPAEPVQDTTPPNTSITSAADGGGVTLANGGITASTAVTLTFAGIDDAGIARFECRLSSAAFSTCTSPVTYNGLAAGHHTVDVRALDTSGNTDATPARHSWTVDTLPETAITSAIDGRGKSVTSGGTSSSSTVTFRFTGTDNGTIVGFECRLDGGQFAPCTTPRTYTGVSRGSHSFRVRAIDNLGSRDASPAVFTWTR
jgi:photosystem II stability/assembly factor-like uncharacterized protein